MRSAFGAPSVHFSRPHLVERSDAGLFLVQPKRVACAFAELLPSARGQERDSQAKRCVLAWSCGFIDVARFLPANEVDASDDVAPLVGPADLDATAVLVVQGLEIKGLK